MAFRAAPPQFEALTGSPGRFTFCLTLPSRKIIAGGLLVGLRAPATGLLEEASAMSSFVSKMVVSAMIGALLVAAEPGSAAAAPISVTSVVKETQAGFNALNGPGAIYNSPGVAGFPDPAVTVDSGTAADLTTTNNNNQISGQDSILLVLTSLLPLEGNQAVTLTFDDLLTNVDHRVTFTSSDFFTTAQAGFPRSSNGQVNGISFAAGNALHAGVDIKYSGALSASTVVASVAVNSPIDLRLDVFGDKQGLIMSRSSNSHSEGVDAPEPSAFLLLGVGVFGLLAVRCRGIR
jgi:hypothetical protein